MCFMYIMFFKTNVPVRPGGRYSMYYSENFGGRGPKNFKGRHQYLFYEE